MDLQRQNRQAGLTLTSKDRWEIAAASMSHKNMSVVVGESGVHRRLELRLHCRWLHISTALIHKTLVFTIEDHYLIRACIILYSEDSPVR